MENWLPFAIDAVLAILLLSAIFIFLTVNKKLSLMKAGQDEFTTAAQELTKAVAAAEQSVQTIKQNATALQQTLGTDIAKGRALSDELKLITEAADSLATRIEQTVSSRPKASGMPDPIESKSSLSASASHSSSNASDDTHKEQRELLAALKDAR